MKPIQYAAFYLFIGLVFHALLILTCINGFLWNVELDIT